MYWHIKNHKGAFWTGARWQTKPFAKVYTQEERDTMDLPPNGAWAKAEKGELAFRGGGKVERYTRQRIYFAVYYKADKRPQELFGLFDVWYRRELVEVLYDAMQLYGFHRNRLEQFNMVEAYPILANTGAQGMTKEIVRAGDKIIFSGLSKEEFNQLIEDLKNGES